MVVQDGLLISKSGKRLGIKLSTAKLIVKRYRETGTFFESKEERVRRLLEEDKKKKA
jgi:transposase